LGTEKPEEKQHQVGPVPFQGSQKAIQVINFNKKKRGKKEKKIGANLQSGGNKGSNKSKPMDLIGSRADHSKGERKKNEGNGRGYLPKRVSKRRRHTANRDLT